MASFQNDMTDNRLEERLEDGFGETQVGYPSHNPRLLIGHDTFPENRKLV